MGLVISILRYFSGRANKSHPGSLLTDFSPGSSYYVDICSSNDATSPLIEDNGISIDSNSVPLVTAKANLDPAEDIKDVVVSIGECLEPKEEANDSKFGDNGDEIAEVMISNDISIDSNSIPLVNAEANLDPAEEIKDVVVSIGGCSKPKEAANDSKVGDNGDEIAEVMISNGFSIDSNSVPLVTAEANLDPVEEIKDVVVSIGGCSEPKEAANDSKVGDNGDEIAEVMISKEIIIIEERKMGPYTSSQRMLLVGEGDFSFSACLALAFGSATNMMATSLDSREFLSTNYRRAMNNIQKLMERGGTVAHGVDATKMEDLFCNIKFDRIIFNFPHAGFHGRTEPSDSQIRRHQKLVSEFLANAKKLVKEDGEIHITHKSRGFFLKWDIRLLALHNDLRVIEEVHFNHRDYPGYSTKYGFGGDNFFNCNPSKTYKLGLLCDN